MKTKKNYFVRLSGFKIPLLLGISLFLSNCETEEIATEQFAVRNELSQIFEKTFNPKDFKKILQYQYTVDWSSPKREFSEQLNLNFYEFPIVYSNDFNPDVFKTILKSKFHEKYKIIVTEKEKGNYEFFVAKYFLNTEKSPNTDYKSMSINENNGYEGTLHLYDKNAEMIFAKHVTDKKELKDFYLKQKKQ